MIDIALAAQGAFKAYELLKKGIERGKELDEMSGTVKAFFRSKHQVERGIEEQEKKRNPNDLLVGSSLEEAIEYIEEQERIAKLEERIKWMYINAGKSATWGKIKREAEKRELAKSNAKIKNKRKADAHDALMKDVMLILGILLGGIVAIGAVIFLILGWGR